MPRKVRFNEDQARAAVAASMSYPEALRRLGLRAAGGNHATLKKYAASWGILSITSTRTAPSGAAGDTR